MSDETNIDVAHASQLLQSYLDINQTLSPFVRQQLTWQYLLKLTQLPELNRSGTSAIWIL